MRKLARGLWKLVRLPGIAPGHAPWQRAILPLNHNREIKRAESCVSLVAVRKDLPAHAISIKNKHLLVIYSIPARGFTAAVSVYWGTPPPKPLICKFVSNRLGARNRSAWARHIGETPSRSCTSIRLALSDIIKTSRCYRSQVVTFRYCHFTVSFREQKTLLTLR